MTKPFLPNDVLQHIFVRLPMKRLAQCKLLSNYWNKTISQPGFSVQGRSRSPNRTLLKSFEMATIYPRHHGGNTICRAVPWNWDIGIRRSVKNNAIIVGSWNGLICFSPAQTQKYVVVWNPLLKDMQECHFKHVRDGSYFFGFGFDNEYKVIKVIQSKNETSIEIHNLYTKVASVVLLSSTQVSFQLTNAAPVTVNGNSHWIGVNSHSRKLELVWFDFGSERFINIPFSNNMPNITLHTGRIEGRKPNAELEIDGKTFRLSVLKHSVCLFVAYPTKVDIWRLKNSKNRDNYTSSRIWEKELEIELSHPRKNVIGFNANEELVIGFIGDRLVAYNPWMQRIVFAIGRMLPSYQVVTYVESLVPVKLPIT